MAVSASGLASMRSKPVKASNKPTASKARLRRPSVTCRTTSASRSRSTASLVDLKVRPMCDGRRGDREHREGREGVQEQKGRRIRAHLPEPGAGILLPGGQLGCEVLGVGTGAAGRGQEQFDPVEKTCGAWALGPGAIEGPDVGIGSSGQDEADGRLHAGGDAPTAQDQLDQRPAGAPVAVSERVDRLELAVRQGGLQKGGVVVACEIGGQVVQ